MTTSPTRGFLDWPIVTDSSQWKADVAICGIPNSEPYPSSPQPNDQASAPNAIRMNSFQFCDGIDHWDFDFNSTVRELKPQRCIDIGDFVWAGPWGSKPYGTFMDETAQALSTLFENNTLLLAMGGDHGATIPLLHALKAVGEPVHIVHIDAHLDWRDEVSGVQNGYSSPLKRASEMPWICDMTQIGLRGTGSARRSEYEDAVSYGAQLIKASDVHAKGVQWVIDQLPEGRPYFLTIDAEGLDPSCMPAVMAPSPGGLNVPQVLQLIDALGRRGRLVGMDVVEIAPAFDLVNKLSCITAGRLLMHGLYTRRQHDLSLLA